MWPGLNCQLGQVERSSLGWLGQGTAANDPTESSGIFLSCIEIHPVFPYFFHSTKIYLGTLG